MNVIPRSHPEVRLLPECVTKSRRDRRTETAMPPPPSRRQISTCSDMATARSGFGGVPCVAGLHGHSATLVRLGRAGNDTCRSALNISARLIRFLIFIGTMTPRPMRPLPRREHLPPGHRFAVSEQCESMPKFLIVSLGLGNEIPPESTDRCYKC